jgi:ABC-type phosphate transport system substrate-binding protein
MNNILFLTLCLTFFSLSVASAEFVVVVNKDNTINTLSKREVIDIYMGRYLTFPDGEIAQPVDLPSKSQLKNDFYLQLVNKNEQKINAYWARLLFSGRAKPPIVASSIADALDKLHTSQYSIGYIPEEELTDAVKVVYRFNVY